MEPLWKQKQHPLFRQKGHFIIESIFKCGIAKIKSKFFKMFEMTVSGIWTLLSLA